MPKTGFRSDSLDEARRLASALSDSLAPAVDPAAVSLTAKIPFKALLLRELLSYRVAELSTVACELFESRRNISGILQTRAALESISWLFFLDRRMKKCLKRGDLDHFATFIDRLLFGSRSKETKHQAYNVLDAINAVNEEIPAFLNAYEMCSEFAHPNADGMIHSYARMDRETILFHLDTQKHQVPLDGVVPILAGGLELFIHVYNGMPDYLPQFARLCEEGLKSET